ncbi:Uncharacterized protein TPAR_04224 [Tolypocladium paradoxum]|uniref:Prolyl 4-hydroxylase alpha subunit Fe(2+) 2OG dioxygenase domain-containing protein n=1 Tax=Tolypocladium paradoxum TaxID=94208 RepID=A0A2S4KZI9_9HYPO|nr:Uncharacterized protein TPAR_04224 [Tolypocladium paradoxum]
MASKPGSTALSSAVATLEHDDAASVASDLSTNSYHVGLKQDLLSALSSIQTPGSFAAFGALARQPPAGLFVSGVGDIAMPLGESQARQLMAKARQAPYGKGSDTIVDTAVRNTWELEPEQFAFRDPAWPGHLRALRARVAQDLGINTTIRAGIYKMLIYEKGAMFKAHTDTEKISGMFGTLVVCLPSAHQGGEVVLKHCGEKKVFKTSEATQSYACWYSDVSHEVLPVTSGYRWVLIYNLALDVAETRPSAGVQRSETRALRHTLRRWLAEGGASRKRKCIYHVLDHDYTEANVSLRGLKTRDLAQVQVLQDMSSELPVEIFLALLEKEEMGSCEHDHWGSRYSRRGAYDDEEDESGFHALEDVLESSYKVKTLVDLEGRLVTQDLRLDEDDILQEDCFEDLEAEEEYEGYMGNSGPTATHWYRVTAVVIVPRKSVVSFFNSRDVFSSRDGYTSSRKNLQPQIRYFARACLELQAPESSVTALVKLCEQAWNNPPMSSYGYDPNQPAIDGKGMCDVLKVGVQRGRYAFFEKAAAQHKGLLPTSFFAWARLWLGDDANQRFEDIQKGYVRQLASSEHSGANHGSLCSAVSSYPSFANQFSAVAHFAPVPNDLLAPDAVRTPDCILAWARRTLRSSLHACASMSSRLAEADGSAMVDVALYFKDPYAVLSGVVAPKIDRRRDAGAFFLAFLARLRQQSSEGILPTEKCRQLYRTMARAFITCNSFTQMHGEEKGVDRPTAVSHEALSDFFSAMIKTSTDADDLLTPLISQLVSDAPRFPAAAFHSLWLPLLHSLIPILDANVIPLDTPRYQQLFSAVLKAFLNTHVGREPAKNTNLARSGVHCNCSDCGPLSAFLAGPAQRVGLFRMNKQRRQHLHQRLDDAGVDCTHETRRVGSPQTLVVTKTFQRNEKNRRDWAARRALAVEQVRKFDRLQLGLLLGPDYASIASMDYLSATRPARGPLQGIGSLGLARPPVAGVKRKLPPAEADIIDLTGDD